MKLALSYSNSNLSNIHSADKQTLMATIEHCLKNIQAHNSVNEKDKNVCDNENMNGCGSYKEFIFLQNNMKELVTDMYSHILQHR